MKNSREKAAAWIQKGLMSSFKSLGKQTPRTREMYHQGHANFHEKQAKMHTAMGNYDKADKHMSEQMKHMKLASKYGKMHRQGVTKL